MAFRRVLEGGFVNFENIGDDIEGFLEAITLEDTKLGKLHLATIRQGQAKIKFPIGGLLWEYPWGNFLGKYIRVVFSGWTTIRTTHFKKFDVFIDFEKEAEKGNENA